MVTQVVDLLSFWTKLYFTQSDLPFEAKYGYGQHKRQYFLFFLPKKVTKQHVVLYIHGGGWKFGKPENFRPNAQVFIERGYPVIMPSYRRLPKYNSIDLELDLEYILKQTKIVLEKENMQDFKIILGGNSAGGHLAAKILYDRDLLRRVGMKREQFAGLFALAAPLDLAPIPYKLYINRLAGTVDSEQFKKANPINFLEENEYHPFLCVHGTSDGIVPFQCSTNFVERLQEINRGIVEFQILPDGRHLDIAKWFYKKDIVSKRLFYWLEQFQ